MTFLLLFGFKSVSREDGYRFKKPKYLLLDITVIKEKTSRRTQILRKNKLNNFLYLKALMAE